MDELKLLKLAYYGALEIWSREYDRLQANPANEITKIREEKANRDLEEIRAMLLVAETAAEM